VFTVRILVVIENCFGMSWLALSDNVSWCIGGDFNVTRFPSERSGEAHLCFVMMEFSDFISDQGLMDLPLARGSFTWALSHDPPVWSRIHRFLVSPD
jgi:hypothetical protein